jgi:hypothetical protein
LPLASFYSVCVCVLTANRRAHIKKG